jgi:6-phosphofructokinase 1
MPIKRVAVNTGAGFVPGMNAVLKGMALAAYEQGWEVVGIRDGFAGLLHPDRYPDGGVMPLHRDLVESLELDAGSVLGQSGMIDPFNVRRVDEHGMVEEVDESDRLLQALRDARIDALVSVVGRRGLTIFHKLHRKGLPSVCIPQSIEGDIASTRISFGFHSALSFTIEMLDRTRHAAQSARRVGVVEVLGEQAGWLALQGGIAAGADAILIPEVPCDLGFVASRLREKISPARPYGLVVVAEGATLASGDREEPAEGVAAGSLQASLSPLARGESSAHVIERSGLVANTVANRLQMLMAEEMHPLVLGSWVRGGAPTAVDRQLGLAYGSSAVQALRDGRDGVMVGFAPPKIELIPLAQAINKVRIVQPDDFFIQVAQSLGICLGRELS